MRKKTQLFQQAITHNFTVFSSKPCIIKKVDCPRETQRTFVNYVPVFYLYVFIYVLGNKKE